MAQAQFTQTGLSARDRAEAQQDVNAFTKYDHYFTLMAAAEAPTWDVWGKLTGSKEWTTNMGSLMKTVTPERSPVREQQPRPENITAPAKRNVYGQGERQEEARVKHQKFESDQIHWLGTWQDVRSNQLDPLVKDITRQQSIWGGHFTRDQAFQRAPYIWICGYDGSNANFGKGQLITAPNSKDNADAVPKTVDFLTEAANVCKRHYTLEELDRSYLALKKDLGATPFGGPKNGQPLKNDLMQGTYQAVIDDETWSNYKWSENANFLKSNDDGYAFKTFKGRLFGLIDAQAEQYPLYMTAAGTFPDPEIADDNGNTRPNPEYFNCPFVWNWICGDDFGASLQIGPPPKDFSSGKVTDASAKLVWNGKPMLTDKFLVKHGNGDVEMNATYGEFRKVIAKTICGYVPKRALNMIPVLSLRARVARY
jgi:hypothetical protein